MVAMKRPAAQTSHKQSATKGSPAPPAKKQKASPAPPSQKKQKASSPPPPPKKPTTDPMVAGIIAGLKQASDLSEKCRDMLIASTPLCLLIPADERHEHQEMVINMISEVLNGIQEKMQAGIDADSAKLAEAEEVKRCHEGKIASANALLTTRAEEVEAKKWESAKAAEAVLDAKTRITEARDAQTQGTSDLVKAEEEKDVVQKVITEHLSSLKDEGEATIGNKNLDAMLPLVKRLELDESLINALPTTFSKKPSERSTFDNMVINQMETNLTDHVARLLDTLAAGSAASTQRAAAVAEAETMLSDANENDQRLITETEAAKAAHSEATTMLKETEAASKECLLEYERLVGERDNKNFDLDNFTNYNLLCFTTLRDTTSKKDEPMLEGTEPAAAAEEAGTEQAAAAAAAEEAGTEPAEHDEPMVEATEPAAVEDAGTEPAEQPAQPEA